MSECVARGSVGSSGQRALKQSQMSQKLSNFLRDSWFPVLTCIGMAIHGWYTITYAQKDQTRAITELQHQVVDISTLKATVATHTNELAEMKKFLFRYERSMQRNERNLDRVTWVVEELAKKQGISPPKTLSENYE